MLRDLIAFRAGPARALRRARPRQERRGTALIISLTDQIYQVKLEGDAIIIAPCQQVPSPAS